MKRCVQRHNLITAFFFFFVSERINNVVSSICFVFYVAVIFHPSFLEDHSQGQIFDFLRGIKKGNIESGSGKESMSTG